jgi:hypothetical protein
MAVIPKSPFPDVPKLPGVPQVARSPRFPAAPPPALAIASALGSLWAAINAKPQWGIFSQVNPNDLEPVLVPDSILDFDYRNSYVVSDFPVQKGTFASYNKVATPFEIVIRMSKSGTLEDRSIFLANLDVLIKSTNLYSVITPERTYRDCNIVDYSIARRQQTGAYFLTDVNVSIKEIRQITPVYSTAASATANAQNPSALPATNLGKVAPATPPAAASFNPAASVGAHP